jgi:hypothetical protein
MATKEPPVKGTPGVGVGPNKITRDGQPSAYTEADPEYIRLLREAFDLTEEQWRENQKSIQHMIDTGVPDLKLLGKNADAANMLVLLNVGRQERGLPKITPEEFVGGYESAAADAEGDKEGSAAAHKALRQLGEQTEAKLTPAEEAIIEVNRRRQEQQVRASREAALSTARARGLGGTNMQFQAGLASQQEQGERRMLEDLGASGMAVERAGDALRDYGKLGLDIDTQKFDQEYQTGSAADDAIKNSKLLEQDWQKYKTSTESQENKDRWGRINDVSGQAYGVIADTYTHGTNPIDLETRLRLGKAGLGTTGASNTASQIQTLAGATEAKEAHDSIDDDEDEDLLDYIT